MHWLIVMPRRRLQFIPPDSPGSWKLRNVATCHSVLLIRSPQAGLFVFDPTLEQYGHPREHRFLKWNDYKARYILRQIRSLGGKVWVVMHCLEKMVGNNECRISRYWQDARWAVNTCIDSWVQDIAAGGLSFIHSLKDVETYNTGVRKLMMNVAQTMNQVQAQPAF